MPDVFPKNGDFQSPQHSHRHRNAAGLIRREGRCMVTSIMLYFLNHQMIYFDTKDCLYSGTLEWVHNHFRSRNIFTTVKFRLIDGGHRLFVFNRQRQ
jgi:hypothetical protein